MALHVRDVGGLGICIMIMGNQFFVMVPEIACNESQNAVGRFAAFLCSFLTLEVFGDDDSYIPLLICCRQPHAIVALHVVMSDVYHRTFIFIETHLPLVCPLNNLLISSCNSILSSGFRALWQSLVSSANLDILTILVSRSFNIRNSSRPHTLPCGKPDVTGAQLL